jgi:hypothetical protein
MFFKEDAVSFPYLQKQGALFPTTSATLPKYYLYQLEFAPYDNPSANFAKPYVIPF